MTTEIIRNTLRFFVLLLAQVLIVQNINLSGYVILFPYILFVIMLPFETNKHLVLFLSFMMGLCMDFFYDSAGIHTSACSLIGFIRPYVLEYIAPRDGYDSGVQPTIQDMGLEWFLRFAGTLVIAHHTFVFFLEIFRFSEFFHTLLRVVLSSLASFGLICALQIIFIPNPSRK
ncbi:MAG TPA: rod shape-determining protein MreD [Bacteroidia bacterium]|nr:rod shape-determining protein MreD [Bacteroidia bacterium]